MPGGSPESPHEVRGTKLPYSSVRLPRPVAWCIARVSFGDGCVEEGGVSPVRQGCRIGMMVVLGVFLYATAVAGPIHDAAGAGEVEQVRRLLAEGTDVNAKTDEGNTPLHAAAAWGHRDVVAVLLSAGADVNAKERNGMTPLHFAANGDHDNVAALLIESGADVNANAVNGWTPLHVAALWGHERVAKALIAAGADVNAKAEHGAAPLHSSGITSRCHKDVYQFFAEKGADVDADAFDGMQPLHVAALGGQNEMAGYLIANGADVERKFRRRLETVACGGSLGARGRGRDPHR